MSAEMNSQGRREEVVDEMKNLIRQPVSVDRQQSEKKSAD